MKISRDLLGVAVLFVGVGGLFGCTTNHYLVYDVVDVETEPWSVELQGQFDEAARKGQVVAITHWANPTVKVHDDETHRIRYPDHHFSIYRLKQGDMEPLRTVRFDNQFGEASVDVRDAPFLMVPAWKRSDPDVEAPEGLDHYKVYEVVKVNAAPPSPTVRLEDQFGTLERVELGPPVFFCVPVTKAREDRNPERIHDPDNHLVAYELPKLEQRGPVLSVDQFMEQRLEVERPRFLLVPSEKTAFKTHGG